jgi:subtilisin
MEWISAHADVIEMANLSLSGFVSNNDCTSRQGQSLHTAICNVVDKGVTVVVAAGNESLDVNADGIAPAVYPEVITVSAMGDSDGLPGGLGGLVTCGDFIVPEDNQSDDHFAFFSNYGEAADIPAPGVCVSSTYIGSQYAFSAGTSFSTPLVAGAAALYISTHPDATPAEVRQALIDRAEPGPIPGDPDNYPEGVLNVRGL